MNKMYTSNTCTYVQTVKSTFTCLCSPRITTNFHNDRSVTFMKLLAIVWGWWRCSLSEVYHQLPVNIINADSLGQLSTSHAASPVSSKPYWKKKPTLIITWTTVSLQFPLHYTNKKRSKWMCKKNWGEISCIISDVMISVFTATNLSQKYISL